MKTCYLHIGHGKTATSSLQAFMHANDDLFEASGIWVPGDYRRLKSLNCKAIAAAGRNFAGNLGPVFNAKVKGDTALYEALLEQIFSCDSDLLLSTELLFYYTFFVREVIGYANKHGFAVTLIAYLRRQDRAVVPAFYQNVRNHGYYKDLSCFLLDTASTRYFRYAEVIGAYSLSAPNRIVVRTFEPEYLAGGDIIEDFLTALGVKIPLNSIRRPEKRANPSLPLESLEIIRGLNALGREDLVRNVINRSLENIQPDESRRVVDYYYTADVAETVAANFMSTNEELIDIYLPDRPEAERLYWLNSPDAPNGPVQLDAAKLGSALSSVLTVPDPL